MLKDQNDEAQGCLRQVLQIDPERDDARFRLAVLLIDGHLEGEAVPHLEYLQKRQPDRTQILVELARCYTVQGQYEQADTALSQVLAQDPNNREALAGRGKLYMQWERVEEAEKYLRLAVELDPGNYSARYQLYLCLSKLKKTEEADKQKARLETMEEDLRKLQKIVTERMQQNPNDPAVHYELAMISMKAGYGDEGVRWLHSCLKIDPYYPPAHKILATYYQRTGDLGRANFHMQMYQNSLTKPSKP
jgi:Tfp pilus assembly protein PilF